MRESITTSGLHPVCEMCETPLQDYGAILISPPHGVVHNKGDQTVSKYHICVACWPELIERLKK